MNMTPANNQVDNFLSNIGITIDPDMPVAERSEVMDLLKSMGINLPEMPDPEPEPVQESSLAEDPLGEMIEAIANEVLSGDSEKVGYFRASGATVVWSRRGGNFVEIAVAHLGKGDQFCLASGVMTAVEHLAKGNFIIVPCDDKVPGFTAKDVAESIFNHDILSGDLVVSAKIQKDYEDETAAVLKDVGAKYEAVMKAERTRRSV